MNLDYFLLPDLATMALLLMCHMCSLYYNQVVNFVKFRNPRKDALYHLNYIFTYMGSICGMHVIHNS